MTNCVLRVVSSTALAQDEANAYILVFPGLEDKPVEEWWTTPQGSLLDNLIRRIRPGLSLQIVEAIHGLTLDNFKSWNQLLIQAESLLQHVERFHQHPDHRQKPLVFLCHSLGGVILKQLLVLARRKDDRSKWLFDALAGIIFLGTPHLSMSNKLKWSNVVGILTSRSRSIPDNLTELESLGVLADLSPHFEHLDLRVPVLSVVEQRETKVRRPRRIAWGAPEKFMIDSSLCTTGLASEKRIFVDCDHTSLCTSEMKSSSFQELLSFSHDALKMKQAAMSGPHYDDHLNASAATASHDRRDAAQDLSSATHTESGVSGPRSTREHPTQQESLQVLSRIRYSDSRREVELPCYLLDKSIMVRDFFGRSSDLETLHKALVVPEGMEVMPQLKTLAIWGMGGIGKTSVAAEFVKTRQSEFDAIFWLNADTAGKLADSFGKMALSLNLQKPGEDRDKVMSRTLVLDWLADPVKSYKNTSPDSQRKAKWLMVFDNVDDFSLMADFWPPEGVGSVLLTSRDPLAKLCAQEYTNPDQSKLTTDLHLKPFNESEAAEFLSCLTQDDAISGLQGNKTTSIDKAAREIAQRLQGLPLALRQLAGIMTRRSLTFHDLLKVYNEEAKHKILHETWEGIRRAGSMYNIATVWGLENLEPGARMLMNVLSFYDPDHIQEEILKDGASHVEAAAYPKTNTDYTTARGELWKSSLITLEVDVRRESAAANNSGNTSDAVNGHIQERVETSGLDLSREPAHERLEQALPELNVHRVVQDAARAKMNTEQLCEAFKAAVTLLLARWRRKKRLWHYDREDWPRADHLYPHVTQLHSHYYKMTLEHQKLVASEDFVKLLNCAGWYDHERGRSEESKTIFTTAFKICTTHLDLDEEIFLEIHTSLGCVATEINDPKTCFEHYQLLLDLTVKKYAQPRAVEDFDALMVANNEMGIAHMMMSHIHEAYELFEEARRMAHIHLHNSDTAHSIYMLSSANLGLAQWLDDQLEPALETLMPAWNHHLSLVESGATASFAPGRLAHAIGNVKESQDLVPERQATGEALDWYKTAYDHYETTIGIYHHRTADVCHKLAALHIKAREYDLAHFYINRALETFKSRSHYKPELARTSHLRSTLLRAEGRTEEADEVSHAAKSFYAAYMRDLKRDKFVNKIPRQADFDKIVTFWSR